MERSLRQVDPPPKPMKAAVFLDRDGTLNVEKGYLSRPAELELIPGATKALQRLANAGFALFLVTNQSGIGRGLYTESDMQAVHKRLNHLLSAEGVTLAGVYYAPEAPEVASAGRKPSPFFLQEAAREHRVDLARSYMVGDKLSDLQCGWNAGVKASILVRTGYGSVWEREAPTALAQAVIVNDINAAADWILSQA